MPPRRIFPAAGFLLPVLLLLATLFPKPAEAIGQPPPVTVSVEGEVRNPGSYELPAGSTLSALILAAGGYADHADPHNATLARESARAAQGKELREILGRLERTRSERPGGWDAWRSFLDGLGALPPLGRLPVPLTHPRLLKNSPQDLPLEDGDALRVPGRTTTVTVRGAVRDPGKTLPFVENAGPEAYVRGAGGYREDADRRRAYLLRPNGAATPSRPGRIVWNPAASRWEIPALAGGGPAVGPGDTIFVPKKPAPGSRAASVKDLHELLMRIAGITGAVPELP